MVVFFLCEAGGVKDMCLCLIFAMEKPWGSFGLEGKGREC